MLPPYFSERYGNPSSVYSLGSHSKVAVENAREKIAKAIGANPKEIFFLRLVVRRQIIGH